MRGFMSRFKKMSWDDFIALEHISFIDFKEEILINIFTKPVMQEFQLIYLEDFKDIDKILIGIYGKLKIDDYLWEEVVNLKELSKYVDIVDLLNYLFKKDLIHACLLINIEDVIKLLKIYLEDKDFKYILSENGDVILFP